MWKLCLEPLILFVEPIDLPLKLLCGTFMLNLGKPEPLCETWQLLRVEPLCGTTVNLSLYMEPGNFFEWNLYVEPRGT